MDFKSYRMNDCSVLLYLMEAGMNATAPLFNGKFYHVLVVEKKNVHVDGIEGIKLIYT